MKTVLRAPVELFEISAFAEVAVWENRPELQRLFRSGEAGGKVDAAVVAAALPGLSDAACRNLLRTIEHLKLIEGNGVITAFGRRCGELGDVPAWELGVFTFLVAKHACFGARPVAFRRGKVDGQDRDFSTLVPIPVWFSANGRQIWTSGFEDKQQFTIARFPTSADKVAYCREEALSPARLVWEMDLATGKNQVHVEGEVVGNEGAIPFRTADTSVPEPEVASLFASWETRWSAAASRVLIPYDGAADLDGHDTFVRSLTYRGVQAGAHGKFDTATVDGVPVGPRSAAEARVWATALALARTDSAGNYVSPDAWTRDWTAAIAGTPLEATAGTSPDVSTLLEQQTTLSPRLRWLLAAGTDLTME